MAQLIYLTPIERAPYKDGDGDELWLIVKPFANDGKFCGTGESRKPTGEWVGYASRAENDVSLEKALAAAQEWAEDSTGAAKRSLNVRITSPDEGSGPKARAKTSSAARRQWRPAPPLASESGGIAANLRALAHSGARGHVDGGCPVAEAP